MELCRGFIADHSELRSAAWRALDSGSSPSANPAQSKILRPVAAAQMSSDGGILRTGLWTAPTV